MARRSGRVRGPDVGGVSRYAARMALIGVVVLASLVLMALAFVNRKR